MTTIDIAGTHTTRCSTSATVAVRATGATGATGATATVGLPPGTVQVGFRSGVSLHPVQGAYELRHAWGRHRLSGLQSEELAVLHQLIDGTVDHRRFRGGRLASVLNRLGNLITLSLHVGDRLGIIVVPINRGAVVPRPDVAVLESAVELSRFSYLHPAPRGAEQLAPCAPNPLLVLESPASAHRLELHDATVVAFIGQLAGSGSWPAAASRVGLDDATARALMSVLAGTGLLADQDEALALWEFQDLLFHQRSRYGRHDYPSGGQFSHSDQPHASALPAMPVGDGAIELVVPRWHEVLAGDRTLTEAIEGRRSVRQYDQLITAEQVGELLYRTARARAVRWTGGEHSYEAVDRPYPTGGGMGELEIYLVIHRCQSISSGVYHYDSGGHRLRPCRSHDPITMQTLAAQAWLATGGQATEPQIQLFVTSRLSRLQWKYNAISYALTLKHVGVLFQNLYLVATSMGLSACGNGSGDTELLLQAADLDPALEAPVGEFLIGGAGTEVSRVQAGFHDVVDVVRAGVPMTDPSDQR